MNLWECSKLWMCLSRWFKISSGGWGATDAQSSKSQDFSESKLEISTTYLYTLHVLQREEMCRSILVTKSHWIFMEILKWVNIPRYLLKLKKAAWKQITGSTEFVSAGQHKFLKSHTEIVKCAMSWCYTIKLVNSSKIQEIMRKAKQN